MPPGRPRPPARTVMLPMFNPALCRQTYGFNECGSWSHPLTCGARPDRPAAVRGARLGQDFDCQDRPAFPADRPGDPAGDLAVAVRTASPMGFGVELANRPVICPNRFWRWC